MMMGYLLILREGEVSSSALLCLNHSLHAFILVNKLVLALNAVYSTALVSGWGGFVIEGGYWAIHRVNSISYPWVLDWWLAEHRRVLTANRLLCILHHFHNWVIGKFLLIWTLRGRFRNDSKRGIRYVLGRVRLASVSLYEGLFRLVPCTNIPHLFVEGGLPIASLQVVFLIKTNLQLFVLLFIFLVDCNWSLCASYLLYEYLTPILIIEELISPFELLMLLPISFTACRG